MAQTEQLLLAHDPCEVLAAFAFHGLATSIHWDAERSEERPLVQHHVALLQALALRHASGMSRRAPVTAVAYDCLREAVVDTADAFLLRRRAGAAGAGANRSQATDDMRGPTQFVRNWGCTCEKVIQRHSGHDQAPALLRCHRL